MEMSIDEHIKILKSYHNSFSGFTGYVGNFKDTIDVAVDIMERYQQIQGLVEYHMLRFLPKERMSGFQQDVLEVLENGIDD